MALYALLRVLLDTRHPDKQHPIVIFIALGLGWCSLAIYLAWLLSDDAAYLQFAIQGGLWLFLLPVFASVGHRMIPFFTSSALSHKIGKQPDWPGWSIIASSVAQGLLQFNDAAIWLWLSDAPLAVAALYLSYTWGLRRSLSVPMLAVLHIGFAWMGVAMLLFTVQSLVAFTSHGAIYILGFAPLHALTIGCFATLLIGMGTRVTLGHSGLPMKADRPIKLMFIGMQFATLLRVLADMLPMQPSWFYIGAAAVWLVCFIPWVIRYLPVYLHPRADGVAG
jgi:uncharacterized protein involved in response to NO